MPPPVDYATLPTTTQEAMRLIQPAMRNAKDGKAVEAIRGFLEAGQVLCATLSKAEPNALSRLEATCAERDSRIQELESKLKTMDGIAHASQNALTLALAEGAPKSDEILKLKEDIVAKNEELCVMELRNNDSRALLAAKEVELIQAKTSAQHNAFIIVITQAGYASRPYAVLPGYTLADYIAMYARKTNQDAESLMVKSQDGTGVEGVFMQRPHHVGFDHILRDPMILRYQTYEISKVIRSTAKRTFEEEESGRPAKRQSF
ncbi:hypothetical protein LTR56_016720 [Elasticomyces elasticus]|nr:hypothetical protein LTR56_016720 [Elasticomyces elasticus]KAK3663114.1 hypothetical protein LTR22_006023 [Elasticomyces elasticus]KAK4905665.1 hypothetical protein LTR49_025054 [Elasticomyces elasticus]KAK5750632.1 hypothetical protein LTS12_019339 [Elasticomyces elasticus]